MTQRDMTRAQFYAALARNGFNRPVLFWISSKDAGGSLGSTSYGVVVNPRTGKIDRRATLAHIIKSRAKDRAKQPHSFSFSATDLVPTLDARGW